MKERIVRVEVQETAKGWMVQWYSGKGGRLGVRVLKTRKRAAKFGKRILLKKQEGIVVLQYKVRGLAT